MIVKAKITSKGQVTVPKSVRTALGLQPGDELFFQVDESRAVVAKAPDLIDLAGSISVPADKKGAAWGEIVEQTRRSRGARGI